MNEIVNFVKEILMLDTNEKTPIGLCRFECSQESAPKPVKRKHNSELRLSELMDK